MRTSLLQHQQGSQLVGDPLPHRGAKTAATPLPLTPALLFACRVWLAGMSSQLWHNWLCHAASSSALWPADSSPAAAGSGKFTNRGWASSSGGKIAAAGSQQ